MKARKLIEEPGSFSPEELNVLWSALEDAWSFILRSFDGERATEKGQLKLAGIIGMPACSGTLEREQQRNDGNQVMNMHLINPFWHLGNRFVKQDPILAAF